MKHVWVAMYDSVLILHTSLHTIPLGSSPASHANGENNI